MLILFHYKWCIWSKSINVFDLLFQFLGFPDSSVGKESACNAGDPGLIPGSGRSARERIGYPLLYSWASLVAQLVKKSVCKVGDLSLIPELGRSPGEGKGYPLQYSGLENSVDYTVYGVLKSWSRLLLSHFSDFYWYFLQISCIYLEYKCYIPLLVAHFSI